MRTVQQLPALPAPDEERIAPTTRTTRTRIPDRHPSATRPNPPQQRPGSSARANPSVLRSDRMEGYGAPDTSVGPSGTPSRSSHERFRGGFYGTGSFDGAEEEDGFYGADRGAGLNQGRGRRRGKRGSHGHGGARSSQGRRRAVPRAPTVTGVARPRPQTAPHQDAAARGSPQRRSHYLDRGGRSGGRSGGGDADLYDDGRHGGGDGHGGGGGPRSRRPGTAGAVPGGSPGGRRPEWDPSPAAAESHGRQQYQPPPPPRTAHTGAARNRSAGAGSASSSSRASSARRPRTAHSGTSSSSHSGRGGDGAGNGGPPVGAASVLGPGEPFFDAVCRRDIDLMERCVDDLLATAPAGLLDSCASFLAAALASKTGSVPANLPEGPRSHGGDAAAAGSTLYTEGPAFAQWKREKVNREREDRERRARIARREERKRRELLSRASSWERERERGWEPVNVGPPVKR